MIIDSYLEIWILKLVVLLITGVLTVEVGNCLLDNFRE